MIISRVVSRITPLYVLVIHIEAFFIEIKKGGGFLGIIVEQDEDGIISKLFLLNELIFIRGVKYE
jgi:hypothetical protein